MADQPTYLASNLKLLLEKRRLNANALSEALNNKPPQATIFRILSGESGTPRDPTIQPLADFFGVPLHVLRYVDLSQDDHAGDLLTRKLPAPKKGVVYVLDLRIGHSPEQHQPDGGLPMGATGEYALSSSDDDRAFLIPVEDASMHPRFQRNEYALVEPSIEPDIEDVVLIRLKNGDMMIRRLISRTGGIRVGLYSTQETTLIDPQTIEWMYYVSNPVPARKIVRQGK